MSYNINEKVNIRNIKDIHADILTYIKKSSSVEINIENCEDCDLSLVQLIESARKSADKNSKIIKLTKPASDSVQSLLKRSGMLDAFSADDAKFWLHREMI